MSGNIIYNDRINRSNGADNDLVNTSHNPTAPQLCSSCLKNATTSTENDVSTPTASYNVLNLSEATPLLTTTNSSLRFENPALNIWQKMWLGLFLTIVIVASGIGIYLLFQEEDRQLPESFELIPKNSWMRDSYQSTLQLESQSQKNNDTNSKTKPANQIPPQYLTLPVSKVVISQSNTTNCVGLYNCKTLLNGFLWKYEGDMPYNFLIDSSGRVYEGRGWFLQAKCDNRLDSLYYCDDVLSIAFIGLQDSKPTLQQISSLRSFLDYSVTKSFIDRCYEIQVRIHNFSKKRYFIDMAFEIQNAHRKVNKCSVYL